MHGSGLTLKSADTVWGIYDDITGCRWFVGRSAAGACSQLLLNRHSSKDGLVLRCGLVFTKANAGEDSTTTHRAIHPPNRFVLRGSAEPVLDYFVEVAETHHRDGGIRA